MEPNLPPRAEMERACRARDASYDGLFFVAVRTTGIFCRPSCPARPPRPENVEFHPTARAAAAAGFRPCRRCHPLEAGGRPPAWVARLVAEVEADPAARLGDAELRARGLAPARVRRHFARAYGMTFHAWRRSRRLGTALDRIRGGERPEEAGWEAGFESASGFRDAFARTFGTSPGGARTADCVRLDWIASPVGPLLVGASERGLALLEFADRGRLEGQLAALGRRLGRPLVPAPSAMVERVRVELADYFAGRRRQFELPLDLAGSPFELAVWGALREIPYGETRSYEEVAVRIGRAGAQRAVGAANGRNRIAIVVPCHRVVNKGGALGGYGGGLWRKRYLLDLERGRGGEGVGGGGQKGDD